MTKTELRQLSINLQNKIGLFVIAIVYFILFQFNLSFVMHFMAIIAAVVEVITAIAAAAICYHAVCCNFMARQSRQETRTRSPRKRPPTPTDTYRDRSLDRYEKRKAEKEREKELDGDPDELGKEEAPRFVFRPPVKRNHHNVRFY